MSVKPGCLKRVATEWDDLMVSLGLEPSTLTQMGPPPLPREHGTPRGARQHWKEGEQLCGSCRSAYNAWQERYRASGQCRVIRLAEDRRQQVESLLRAGHSDWSVHRKTGVARTTVARYRRLLGLPGYRSRNAA